MNCVIKVVKFGCLIFIIGWIIENYVKCFGYGVVCDYIGYGVYSVFYFGFVVFYYDELCYDVIFEEGMMLIIELMFILGD